MVQLVRAVSLLPAADAVFRGHTAVFLWFLEPTQHSGLSRREFRNAARLNARYGLVRRSRRAVLPLSRFPSARACYYGRRDADLPKNAAVQPAEIASGSLCGSGECPECAHDLCQRAAVLPVARPVVNFHPETENRLNLAISSCNLPESVV